MTDEEAREQEPAPFPTILEIAPDAPLRWLKLGWADLRRAPRASLAYGVGFAAMGILLHVFLLNMPHVTLGLATGFTLVGPFLAIGFYDISRRLERGETVRLGTTLFAWRGSVASIGLFSIILLLLLAAWVRVTVVIVALFFTGSIPTPQSFAAQFVFSAENVAFLAIYFGVGALFALLVFSVSVVSIPLMMDRNTDTLTAMIASFLAAVRNAYPMAIWAFLIAVLIAAGMLTFYLGIAVAVPVVGHATWHAYRDVVAPPETE